MAHPQDTNPKDTKILARQNKTATKALCNHELPNGKLCNGDITDIIRLTVNGHSFRKILFPLGWDEQPRGSGIWRETDNARRKRLRGHVGLWRSMPFAGAPAEARAYLARRSPDFYPIWAHCSVSTSHWQKLDATVLEVACQQEVEQMLQAEQGTVVTIQVYPARPRQTHHGGRR